MGAAADVWRLDSGQQSGSRLGFRGTEELGGGLKGIFTLESGFNVDTGTSGQGNRLFGRQAFVGLSGGFGSVKLGRQQTPLYYAMNAVDPFEINLAGNAQRVFGGGLYAIDPFLRTDNTVNYTTANWGGFSGQVAYSFGEAAGSTAPNQQIGVGLAYANGPINVQFAYHDSNTFTLPGTLSFFGTGTANLKTAFLGGTWDFGVAKAHAGLAQTEVDVPIGELKDRNYMLGATVPVGVGSIMASWIRNDVRDVSEGESDQFAIGYSHPVSKRTNFYTSFSHTKNDDAVRVNAFAPGETGKIFNVGVRHRF